MMSREHHRRRSPESSRRRRKERRQSREQLQTHPSPTSILPREEPPPQPQSRQQAYQQPYQQSYQQPYQQPYQQQSYQEPYPAEPSLARNRDRAPSSSYSFTSSSSSTSSSLLNISRPAGRFGIGAFFSGDGRKQRRRIRRKRSKFLRFGNSSSSSVGSDLAYGRGYIDRRRSREFSPPGGHKPPRTDSGAEKPRPPKRAQTDEEIIELGRQFAEIARRKNSEDLRAAGRTRPSTLVGAVAALNQFRRTNSGNLNKGIGNSKPGRDSSSDDSDWESASSDDESGEDDSDNGLAYGSSHHLPANAGGPFHFGASVQSAQTYPQHVPLNRKPSLVDPKLFGPINSLRGYVQTPCGFERVDRNTINDARPHYEPSVALGEKVASAEGRDLRHVFPVPTSDPSRFDAGRGSVVSAQDSTPRPRPDPVPIQQPKPIAPVYTKVFESVDTHPSYSTPQPTTKAVAATADAKRPDISAGKSWSSDAAIGGVLLRAARDINEYQSKNARVNDTKWQPERSTHEEHNEKYEKNDNDVLRDVPSKKPYDQKPKATRDDEREKRRREKAESDLYRDFEKHRRRREKYDDDLDRPADVEEYRWKLRDDQKSTQKESRRDERREDQSIAHEPKTNIPTHSDGPSIERPRETIDPFQYQVADDAFSTRHGTPMRPLTPVIMTVEREPDFSSFGSYAPYERLSRKDSYERELQEVEKAHKSAEKPTVPVSTGAFAAAAVAELVDRQPERSTKPDTNFQEDSERSSSKPQPKDPVLDDADRAYREARLARRIREQEERSRSNSPDKSVVDKWKDGKDSANPPQTASSATDQPKQKSRYDGPDADVRIDNILEHPRELARFRISESRRRSSTFPVFSARDPSAERERPMLNVIRPTPAPSPAPEKQQSKDVRVPSSSTEIDDSPASAGTRDVVVSALSTAPSKVVSWGENQTKHYVVETPEREDDPYSGTKVSPPTETSRSRTSKKVDWSAVAAAISGAAVGAAVASSISDAAADTDAAREHVEPKDPPRVSKRRSSLQLDSLYDDPPIPGPKPSSPRSSQTPGGFAEDPGFMANIAAGLEGSGFDPNIIIEDTKFHRRDSPPGSDELFSPSVAATSRSELQDTTIKGKGISVDDSETLSKSSKKERRKQEKAAKRETSDRSASVAYDDSAPDTLRSISDDEWDVPVRKPRRREQKKQDKVARTETWEDDQAPEGSSSTPNELEPIIDDWADTTLKKKKPKKPKKSSKAVVIQQDSPKASQSDPQQNIDVELSRFADLAGPSRDYEIFRAAEPEANLATRDADLKATERESTSHDFDPYLESTSQGPKQASAGFAAVLEDVRKRKKNVEREPAAAEPLPPNASRTVASELPRETSFQIVEPELDPVPGRGYSLPEGSKEGERNLTNIGLPSRSIPVSEAQEDVAEWDVEEISELERSRRGPSHSGRTSLARDIVDSSSLRREDTRAPEEEWEDLPKKSKKKKKSKRDAATREESSRSASQFASPSEDLVEQSKQASNDTTPRDLPSRSAPLSTRIEDERKTEREEGRSAPGGFPDDEDLPDEDKPRDAEVGAAELRDNRESGNSSFFDRFRSSIGLGEGKQQSHPQNESFLGNAGAREASAGLLGAVRALVPRKSPENVTDATPETALPREVEAVERHPSPPPEAEFIDPEIVEREIRPAIDPTYGDLLPLPPSRPNSPAPNLDETIPPLPESRPGTPEDDRERLLLSQKSAHVRRRSDIPLRLKTPSQSAIPIQFRLGQRSTPASPGILKLSPSGSPIVATPETGSTSKVRARPMSWESTRAFKPLLLVEKTSREVAVTPTLLEEESRPSDASDRAPDESYLASGHTSTPHDDSQDTSSTQDVIAQPSESPQHPMTRLEEEPSSPDPVDAVSKNRSSYLYYWSPPNTQNSRDVDMSEGSPTLRAAERRTALEKLTEEAPDDIIDIDLLKPAATDLATDTVAAGALVDNDADSRDVTLDAKDAITSDVAPAGEPTKFVERIDTNDTGDNDIASSEVAVIPEAKPKKGKKEKNKSREIEPLAESSSIEASVALEVPLSSDAPESSAKTTEKEDDSAVPKPSKKDKKKKKKRQSQQPTADDSRPIEAPLPVEDNDEFFDAPAAPVVAESKSQEADIDDLVVAHVETPVEAPADAPIEVPADVPVEGPPEELTEASVDVLVEAPTETSIEAPTEPHAESPAQALQDTPVEAPIDVTTEASRDIFFEAPAEAPVVTPVETPVEIVADIPTEGLAEDLTETPTGVPVETLAEAPVKGSDEARGAPADASVDKLTEAPSDILTEAPVEVLVEAPAKAPEAPADVAIEGPTEGFTEAATIIPIEAPPEAPVDIPDEVSTATPAEGLIGALVEAPSAVLAETPVSEEPVVKSKKGKKKKRKSQIREPEPELEEQAILPISDSQSPEETVTNDRTMVEDPTAARVEMALERDAPLAAPETGTSSHQDQEMKDENLATQEKEEPIVLSTPEDVTAAENLPSTVTSEITHSDEIGTDKHSFEHVQSLPMETENAFPKLEESTAEDTIQASATDKELPATTSKKSKKKKKGKASQTREQEPEVLPAEDIGTVADMAEEFKQQSEAELPSSKAADEPGFSAEAMSSERAPTPSPGNLPNAIAEAVDPSAFMVSDELEEKSNLALETPQLSGDIKEPVIAEVGPGSEELVHDTYGSKETSHILAGELGSVPEEELAADVSQPPEPSDADQLPLKSDTLSGMDIQQEPQATDIAKDGFTGTGAHDLPATSTQSFEATEPPSTLPDAAGDAQVSPLDQLASDELKATEGLPEESQGKKKGKKNRKTQSTPSPSDAQEIATGLPKAEDVQEQPMKDLVSTEQEIQPSPTRDDKALDLVQAEPPTDVASLDTSSSSKKSKKGKKGKKSTRELDSVALEEVVEQSKPEEEVALSNQDIVDPEASVPTTQAESTTDDPWPESTTSEKEDKKEKTDREVEESVALVEDVDQPLEDADSKVTEGDAEPIQQALEPDSLPTPKVDLLAEGELPEVSPEAEVVSSKKSKKKKKRASVQLDSGSSEIVPETADLPGAQRDTSAAPEPSEATDALIQPAADETVPDTTELAIPTQSSSPSSKKSKKKKRQTPAPAESEDTSDLPGPSLEVVPDLEEVSAIPEQVKEDDADISSTSTGTKKSKKDKKKKRQSVQFADPIEESTQIPAESGSGITEPELTTEPLELSSDVRNEPVMHTELTTSPPADAPLDSDRGPDGHPVQDMVASDPIDVDPSSIPLPTGDELGTDVQTVSSPHTESHIQQGDDRLSEPRNDEEPAHTDQYLIPQLQDEIDDSANAKPEGEAPSEKQMDDQNESIKSDAMLDAPVKIDDSMPSNDSLPAETVLTTEEPVPVTAEEKSPLAAKKSKKDKKKRKGKSLESQGSASDSPALTAATDDAIPIAENQESASISLPTEAEVEHPRPVEPTEQSAAEQLVSDSTVPELATEAKQDEESDSKVSTAVPMPAPDVFPSATLEGEAKSQADVFDVPQSTQGEEKPEDLGPSDTSIPQADEQESHLNDAPVTSVPISDDPVISFPTLDEPPAILPPASNDQGQADQDGRNVDPATSQPENEIRSLTDPATNDLSTEKPATLPTLEPEPSVEAQASEEPSSEPIVTRKSKKDKKKKKRDEPAPDKPDTTEQADTEPVSDLRTSAIEVEQIAPDATLETAEEQVVPTQGIETKPQDTESYHEALPVSVSAETLINADGAINLPLSTEAPSDQLPTDETAAEDVDGLSSKKTKKDKKKKKQVSSETNEPPPPEPEEQAAMESLAPVQTTPAIDPSISVLPEPPGDDDDTAKSGTTKKSKKSKKKKKLASTLDEEVSTELPAESTQTGSDGPEQKDNLPTELDTPLAEVLSKTEATLQGEEAVSIEDTPGSALPESSHKDEKEKELAGPSDKEAVSEPQHEPVQTGLDDPDRNITEIPTELGSSPAEEPPKTDDTNETSASVPTKKSKKNKKKKKAASPEEEVSSEDKKDLVDPVFRETEQSDVAPAVPAEVLEGKDMAVESAFQDADVAQDDAVLQDDSTPKGDVVDRDDDTLQHADVTLDTLIPKDEKAQGEEDVTQSDAILQDDSTLKLEVAPESEDATKDQITPDDKAVPDSQPLDDEAPTKKTKKDKKKKKTSITREDESPEDTAEASAEATTVDFVQLAENELLVQEPEHDKSLADPTIIQPSTDDGAKEEQPRSWADELLEEQVTEHPILAAPTNLSEPTEDPVLVTATEPPNDDAVDLTKGKKSKKKKKKQSISQASATPEEQPTEDSAPAAPSEMTDSLTNEPPTAEPSNDDSLAPSTSSKKQAKKDKKKKKLMGSVEDSVAHEETSPIDPLQRVPTPQEPAQQEPTQQEPTLQEPVQEEPAQQESVQQEPPQENLPTEGLLKEEPSGEGLPEEQPSQDLAREDISEVTQQIPAPVDLEQVTLPQGMEADASSEPTTVPKSEERASDEATKVDIPLSDSLPDSTPAKKSKKDKKKKKSVSSLEPEATSQEERVQPVESQTPTIVDTTPEVELQPEGESTKPAAPDDDAKEDDFADPAPTKKSKKDKKKKKQALLETGLPQESVETSVDTIPSVDVIPPVEPILPVILEPSEQAEAKLSLPEISGETDAINIPSPEKSENDEKEKETTREDITALQPEPSQEPDISRDASAEASQGEVLLESTSSKKKKRDKKKKRASVGELKSDPETQAKDRTEPKAEPIEVAELTEVIGPGLSGEQSSVNATEDQIVVPSEARAPGQDEVPNSSSGLQALEPTSTQETVPSIKLDDVVEPTLEPSLDTAPTKGTPEDIPQELTSENLQQSTPLAAEDEPLQEPAPDAVPEIASDNPPPSQEQETVQLETTPKVDEKMDTVTSKKSKKDKKKKKRASQVSWEIGPEAEIEGLPEQQPQEAFDDQPMTSESTEMGNSEEPVEDPISEFASGKKSTQDTERQSQMDWEPEPNSEKTVKESEPLSPSQQGQYHDVLLDRQSLAGDAETSLKDSTTLDDTLPETTSSKKSKKKKKKATPIASDAEPAAPVTSEPAANPFLVEQNVIDKPFEPISAPLAEVAKTVPEDEADTENISPGIVAAKQTALDVPGLEVNTEQPAQSDLTTGSGFPIHIAPEASEDLTLAEDIPSNLENPSSLLEDDVAAGQSRSVLPKEVEPLGDPIQNTEGLSQDQSTMDNKNAPSTAIDMHAEPSHIDSPNDQDALILPSKPEEILDEAALGGQAEIQKDTPAAASHDIPQDLPEVTSKKSKKEKKKAKKAQALSAFDADSKANSGTDLQSWDWSNLDNQTQPATPTTQRTPVLEDSSKARTVEPKEATRETSQQEQKAEPGNDDVDNHRPTPAEPEPQPQLDPQPEPKPEPEPELEVEDIPITRKKSKKEKKKKKGASQSESGSVSTAHPPQAQDFEGGDDLKDTAAPDIPVGETKAMEPLVNEWASLEEDQADQEQKRLKSLLVEEETLREPSQPSQEPAILELPTLDRIPKAENQDTETQSLPLTNEIPEPKEQTSIADDVAAESPANVPETTEDDQLAITPSRPRTPSLNRQVPIAIDMSPAQLSSHIEHDPPFDQSTQPDKKMRTHSIQDDAMVPESISTMASEPRAPTPEGSDSRMADATAIDIPPVSMEPSQQAEANVGVPDYTGEDTTIIHPESDSTNAHDPQAASYQEESQVASLAQEGDKSTSDEVPTSKSGRNKKKKKKQKSQVDEDREIGAAIAGAETEGVAVVAEELGESEKIKGKQRSKFVDKEASKDNGKFGPTTPSESSERKPPEEGSGLDASPGDFRAGLGIDAEAPNESPREVVDVAATEQVLGPTPHRNLETDDVLMESPMKGSEIVPEISKPSDAEEIRPQIKGPSTAKVQDNLDDLSTSEHPEGDHKSPDVSATEPSERSFLPFLPPSRTPSALDYRRSLPPVEEETHEDLEKESQSGLEDKTRVGLEASRDSGFITDSPILQRRSLDPEGDAGQRDSGVHMHNLVEATTPGPSEEKAISKESGIRTDTSPVNEGSSSQTPQSRERRSRRSLFDNETPKLSTPTQGRGWDRGATPDKPTEDEPLKRTTTPLKPHASKYQDLASSSSAGAALNPHTPGQTPQQQTQRSVSDNISDVNRDRDTTPQVESVARRSVSSNTGISRLRTPEPLKFRPESPGSHSIRSMHSIRSLRSLANTPPLRRVDRRMSGDLRSLSHSGGASNTSLPISTRDKDPATSSTSTRDTTRDKDTDRDTAKEAPDRPGLHTTTSTSTTPIANEGRVRAKDMTDVYDGYGEGRIGSPRSPTRPPSMRRRQSMQVLELESRVEQLIAENRALADARARAEQNLNHRNTSAITDRDAEIESLKASLQWLQNEVTRLTEVNEGLQSANSLLALQHTEKYTQLESRHTNATRELEEHRGARDQFTQSIQAKDAEIQELRNQLEATKEQIREMKKQILATKPPDADFLRLKDEDHFDHRCQQLCSHVQQWVLRFSKFSDMRACRLTSEINDEKIIDRLDNTILDGSEVDDYLSDRVARRDIFMSMTMNMIWEFVFTRYLFGMDREQRQKLKSLEKLLTDVGPHHAVRQWRAITLTLLSKRPVFGDQRNQDTEAVVQAILQTLSMILPPPSNLEAQIQSQLRRVMREAVDLSIEMRTQRAEYMMLPPLQPEYDANGELTQTVSFNAALMNERSGDSSTTNEAYEAQGAIVRCVLFPLVVKKGDDNGVGDDEIVVSPAQVLVAKARRSAARMVTPSSDAGGVPLSRGPTPSTYAQSSVSVNMRDAPLTPPGYV